MINLSEFYNLQLYLQSILLLSLPLTTLINYTDITYGKYSNGTNNTVTAWNILYLIK